MLGFIVPPYLASYKVQSFPWLPPEVFLGCMIYLYTRGHLGCHMSCVDLEYDTRLICGSLLVTASFSRSPENSLPTDLALVLQHTVLGKLWCSEQLY